MLQDPRPESSFFFLGAGHQSQLDAVRPRQSFFELEEEKGMPHSFYYPDDQASRRDSDSTANSCSKENVKPKSRAIKKPPQVTPTRKSSRKRKPKIIDSESSD